MTTIRTAVVGLGGIAQLAHLSVLAARIDVELAAVCDPDPAARARQPQIPGFSSVPEMLAAGRLDAALVLTPEHHHEDAVSALLEAGVPVLCEKPLSPTLETSAALRDLSVSTGTTLMVGFNRRFAPVYQHAREALALRPASIGVFEKARRERGFRGSVENLIHMVDLARFFFGECVEVSAHAVYDDPFAEDSLGALLTFESGQIASVVGNRSTGIWTERVHLHGSGQSITVSAPDVVTVAVDGYEMTHRQSTEASGFAAPVDTLGFAAQAEHFFSAVAAGLPVTENDAESAFRTQELMDRILLSAGLPTEDGRIVRSGADL